MSIKSTKEVTRDWAIERIELIYGICNRREYQTLEMVSYEPDYQIQDFIDRNHFYIPSIDSWTNTMLEDKLDEPFFRESIFDNYFVNVREVPTNVSYAELHELFWNTTIEMTNMDIPKKPKY